MKRSFKVAVLCFFAVLLAGCLPQQKLTGRVMDTAGPVPGAAVLTMVWIEDAGKALPAPEIRNLAQMDLDIILEKDMKDRGLPVAYARAFTDENGMFELDTLHFSAETKKAVKVMAQPKISRITLNAFQRGYLKHAATVFPKDIAKELSPAVVRLSKPESWKQLALDNPFRTLRRDEYDQGYSKEFGATKAEKKWFLDYISSNLNEAYQASNIKGDKQWEEDCGRDFSDIVISSSGMQRNPNHEKCNELLREMGVLRDWEKLWVDHSYVPDARQTPAINAIKEAVNALEAEFAEIKQYEAQIIAGAEEAAKEYTAQAQKDLRGGLSEASPLPLKAQNLYRNGDKAGAYKALGHALYSGLPAELKQGIVTAMLPAITLPRIKETTVGFYLLQNRPLTAQLPGGDGGNHKDKVKELDTSSETISEADAGIKLVEEELVFKDEAGQLIIEPALNGPEEVLKKHQPRKLKYIETKKLSAPRLYFKGMAGAADKILPLETKTEELEQGGGKRLERIKSSRPVLSKNNKWVLVDRSIIETPYKVENGKKEYYSYDGQTATGRFDLYDSHGLKRYSKEFVAGRGVSGAYPNIVVADNGTVVVPTDDKPGGGNPIVYVYDSAGQLILEYSYTDADVGGASIDKISPNGRYLAIRAGFNYASTVTVFFDLKTKKSWKAEQDYVIYEMTNDGLVECDYYDDKKKARAPLAVLDIKPYLRE